MQPFDLVNAIFEGVGAFIILLNIRRIRRDKMVRGFDWRVMAFFTAWGFWNLAYYPSLGQWLSFSAGVCIVIMNTIYLWMMIHYLRQERKNG